MQKRILGKTGEEVSLLGFGLMRLPTTKPGDASSIDYDLATAMVRKAIDRGVNYLDTAYVYHRGDTDAAGKSEPFLARVLKDGYRDKVKLATKLPTWLMTSKEQMHDVLDQQLKRMGTSCIDFYLAHNLNRPSWPKMRDIGMLDFLNEAKRDGKIKHIGFSFHDHYELFENIVTSYDWEFAQIQYNYLDTEFQAGDKGRRLAEGRNLGLVVMEPLRGGFLINHMPGEMKEYLKGVRPEWSLADWALRWAWSKSGVGTVLSGMSTMAQVEENLDIADRTAELTADETAALEKVRAHFLKRIKVNCTGCGYCLPCPSGVNIPKIFAMWNNYHMADTDANHKQVRKSYGAQVGEKESAANCVSCGACESKCPQSIKIGTEMPEAAAVLG